MGVGKYDSVFHGTNWENLQVKRLLKILAVAGAVVWGIARGITRGIAPPKDKE